jgi:V-type H+-transporting ATPase proteolipid subunit
MFGEGVSVGIVKILCGIDVGIVGYGEEIDDDDDYKLFVKIMIVEIFGSDIGMFGLIVGI